MADFDRAYEQLRNLGPLHFVGRSTEIETLRRLLVEGRTPVVGVAGTRGIGKTSLVRRFAEQYRDSFPGGVHHLGYSDVQSAKLVRLPATGMRSLVIVDDADAIRGADLAGLVQAVPSSWPDASLIVVSQLALEGRHPQLRIGPLNQSEVSELLASQLVEVGPVDAEALYGTSQGNPLLAELLGRLVRDGRVTTRDLVRLLSDFVQSGVVDDAGSTVTAGTANYLSVVSGLVVANEEVLKHLEAHPEALYHLNPRQFEEFVAELLARQGYEVSLTQFSKDGGKDLYVAHKSGLGSALYVVECKRYGPDNPVGVGIVRQLYGVVQAEQLTGGLVATTSYFTKDAQEFQQSVKYHLSLADYVELRRWIRYALRGPSAEDGTA